MDLTQLWGLKSSPISFVPRQARSVVAAAAATAFTAPEKIRWWMILAFGKLVLSRPPAGTTVTNSLISRAKDFSSLNWAPLLKAAQDADAKRISHPGHKVEMPVVDDPMTPTQYTLPDEVDEVSSARSIRSCVSKVRSGCVSKGMAALSASPVCEWSPATFAAMVEKHPKAEGSEITPAQIARLKAAALTRC